MVQIAKPAFQSFAYNAASNVPLWVAPKFNFQKVIGRIHTIKRVMQLGKSPIRRRTPWWHRQCCFDVELRHPVAARQEVRVSCDSWHRWVDFHFVSAAAQQLMPIQLEEGTLVLCIFTRPESAADVRLSIWWQALEPTFEEFTDRTNAWTP